jgi:hypothetical protein
MLAYLRLCWDSIGPVILAVCPVGSSFGLGEETGLLTTLLPAWNTILIRKETAAAVMAPHPHRVGRELRVR